MNKPQSIKSTALALLLCADGLTKAQWRIIYTAPGGTSPDSEADKYFHGWDKKGYDQGAVYRLVRG